MRYLSFIIIILFLFQWNIFGQSPHGKDLKFDCSDCHISTSWKEIPADKKFSHNQTGFNLTGQHKSLDCNQCHKSKVFSTVKTDCFSCHKDVHNNTTSLDCSNCHSTQNWLVTDINEIHQRSRFPLVGQHVRLDCSQCHFSFSNLNFNVLGVECISCHQKDFMAAKNPDHVASGFSTECNSCHEINSSLWAYSSFAHDFFPLVGGHKTTNCFSCHNQNKFSGLSTDCYSCHKSAYEAVKDPDHVKGNFGNNCVSCHTINGWKPANFDHNITGFELVGMHKSLNCNSCHSAGYTNLPLSCYGCHKNDYDSSTNPSHLAAKFPTNCEQCHTSNGWRPSTFDHNATAFPLTGAHVNSSCISCHSTGYTGISTDCYSCHKTNYDNTTNPNHITAGISTDCKQCHSTTGWTPATFDHNATAFPLTGAHVNTSCISCHSTGYTSISTDCYSCHKTNYDNTTNPNHITAGIPTDCKQCHSTTGWTPATFDHNATAFPLTGAHVTVSCNSCHTNGYTGTQTDCYSCHKSNYDNATDPNHVASNFPTDCKQCHTTTAWKPASFDHNATSFPLTGRHVNVSCSACHTNGYTGTSTLCYSCHKSNYDSTTNPNHTAANFPTACEQCHNTNGWTPATFDHDNQYFPIYSGNHRGKWNTCADCHTNQNNYSVFSCINCHEHNQTDTDRKHRDVRNYVYDSNNCYSCHPRGNGG